ncbi:MAG: sensor histidine kinase, partial [Chloroflexota bacterium]
SMLSHDFRGPLAIAKAYLHGLMGRLEGTEREACEEIDSEIQQLEQMTDNLMVSLQLEAQHQLVLDPQELDLLALARSQASRMERSSAGHTVTVATEAEDCLVVGDRLKITSVLANLLGNAIKYSPGGGAIQVDVRCSPETAEVRVSDSGIGIDEREAESLFDRYGRGDAALHQGIRGHGLGLFICRQIIEAHGGSIFARPVPAGSCFTFTLPRRSASAT